MHCYVWMLGSYDCMTLWLWKFIEHMFVLDLKNWKQTRGSMRFMYCIVAGLNGTSAFENQGVEKLQ